ncbi:MULTISPECIES: hypothetical protein [Haloferax]|uniref:Uncharacterized protein n=2 Tax=Haloferax TaxID=2251 RepID=A0ACD5HY21_9EURY|nr:hypothetical protein [Haloferax alexandrinus]NLV03431.1 hypothetical protein [Haloferax alexandrinus]
MGKLSKCYLIGAGASFGHCDLDSIDTPPTGEWIFADAWKKGILKLDEFEPFFDKLVSYLDDQGELNELEPDELEYNSEILLKELHEEVEDSYQQVLTGAGSPTDSLKDTQAALGTCYYLLYELFRRYSNSFSPEHSYYTDLAKQIEKESASVVSLNYDVLMEKSIRHTGQNFYYLPDSQNEDGVPIAKVHGSINLLNDFGSGIKIDSEKFTEKARNIHLNTTHNSEIRQLSFEELERYDFRNLVFGMETQYEPVIIPPLAKHKNYNKTSIYRSIWDFAGDILSQTNELVIIGTSLTANDEQLLNLLESNLQDNIKITVVCGQQSKSVKAQLNMRVENPSFDLDYTYFKDYVDNI